MDGELAGRVVEAGKVLVVSAEPNAKWRERREALGVGDHVHIISRPFASRARWQEWKTFTEGLAMLVAERGYDLVVLDALPNLWPVADENDASQVISGLLPLQAVAGAGAAVLLLRHPRKSDGGQGTAGRGSGAITGFVDIILEMRRYEPESSASALRLLPLRTVRGRDPLARGRAVHHAGDTDCLWPPQLKGRPQVSQ